MLVNGPQLHTIKRASRYVAVVDIQSRAPAKSVFPAVETSILFSQTQTCCLFQVIARSDEIIVVARTVTAPSVNAACCRDKYPTKAYYAKIALLSGREVQ